MTADGNALRAPLVRARLAVIATRGVLEQVAPLPAGSTVTVTASPARGIKPTLELAGQLARRDLTVVPHLAARLISGKEELVQILERLAALHLSEVFVVAGDARHPAGPFEGAAALLEAMAHLGHDLLAPRRHSP
jgi:methylenetetrahydrofolate reductase (NADPH)